MKILLVANTAWYLFNFRLGLARHLQACGADVVLVSPCDEYAARLQQAGFCWLELKMSRAGINPLVEFRVVRRFQEIYRRERPDLVHHFTIKCVLYGSLAARLTAVPSVVNTVTGLGHVFIDDGWRMRAARPLVRAFYRMALNGGRTHVVFQNAHDRNTFVRRHLVWPDSCSVIQGSGVDTQRFAPTSATSTLADGVPIVLFAGRLIAEKGVYEYVEAARILKERQVQASFQICGDSDPGNPSCVPSSTIEEWRRRATVELLGHVDQIQQRMADSSVVVLPSYREGTPRVLLEAAAMAKPIVATDVPGCREVVTNGDNGLLVPARNPAALATAIETLLGDRERCRAFGHAGRMKVLREFDELLVIQKTLDVYRQMLSAKHRRLIDTNHQRIPTNATTTQPMAEGRLT